MLFEGVEIQSLAGVGAEISARLSVQGISISKTLGNKAFRSVQYFMLSFSLINSSHQHFDYCFSTALRRLVTSKSIGFS